MTDERVAMKGEIRGRRPWEWLDSEPVTARDRRLAELPPSFEHRLAVTGASRRDLDVELGEVEAVA